MGWIPPPPPKFDNVPNFNGTWVGQGRPIPVHSAPTPKWNPMCEGCGAPLQRHEINCAWCLRATPYADEAEVLMVQLSRFPTRAVASGLLTVNEARAIVGLPPLRDRRYTGSHGPG